MVHMWVAVVELGSLVTHTRQEEPDTCFQVLTFDALEVEPEGSSRTEPVRSLVRRKQAFVVVMQAAANGWALIATSLVRDQTLAAPRGCPLKRDELGPLG